MNLIGVSEVWHEGQESAILYHDACYAPIASQKDVRVWLTGVPDEPLEYLPLWIDPGCAICGRGLAVHPINEQMERDFLRTVDEWEHKFLV